MKKVLFLIVLVLLCGCAFAASYPFGVVVFPASIDNSIELSQDFSLFVTNEVSNGINAHESFCSICYNKNNMFVKYMVEEGLLEDTDLSDVIDPGDAERIATAMEADGYCYVNVKSFSNDNSKKFVAKAIVNVVIYKIGEDEPIFDKDIEAVYNPLKGYFKSLSNEKAFEKTMNSLPKSLNKKLGKLNGYSFKELKVVEPPVLEDEEE